MAKNKLEQLNLGCGTNKKEGFVNVDKFGNPDQKVDLEEFPWPWKTASISVIEMSHTLEHLGATVNLYFKIWQELYRVLKPEGLVKITVPHFRHDFFANDPTHVRVVLPEGLRLFDQSFNKHCEENHWANSQLGRYLEIDFKVTAEEFRVDKQTKAWLEKRTIDTEALRYYVNIYEEIYVVMQAVKPCRYPILVKK